MTQQKTPKIFHEMLVCGVRQHLKLKKTHYMWLVFDKVAKPDLQCPQQMEARHPVPKVLWLLAILCSVSAAAAFIYLSVSSWLGSPTVITDVSLTRPKVKDYMMLETKAFLNFENVLLSYRSTTSCRCSPFARKIPTWSFWYGEMVVCIGICGKCFCVFSVFEPAGNVQGPTCRGGGRDLLGFAQVPGAKKTLFKSSIVPKYRFPYVFLFFKFFERTTLKWLRRRSWTRAGTKWFPRQVRRGRNNQLVQLVCFTEKARFQSTSLAPAGG